MKHFPASFDERKGSCTYMHEMGQVLLIRNVDLLRGHANCNREIQRTSERFFG